MSRVRRPPPTAKPNVLLSFFLSALFFPLLLSHSSSLLPSTWSSTVDYVVRARRCSPRMDAFFAFLSTTAAPAQGPGYSASSRSVQIEVTFPKCSRLDRDRSEFYSVLCAPPKRSKCGDSIRRPVRRLVRKRDIVRFCFVSILYSENFVPVLSNNIKVVFLFAI